ncbi:MAG: TonB-dependent receptor [Bacteroidales bacterium]|nr:TonB-dependent receptor [Bacteroidales bacterium]
MAVTLPVEAQAVKGILVDEYNAPVPSAVVTLARADSTIIARAVTDTIGGFGIKAEYVGEAILSVSHITYLPYSGIITLPHPDSLRITLKINAEEIDKVVVVGERPLMEMTDEGNLRFNVSQVRGINNKIADVINKLPGATASDMRGFTLNGQTATLYIDGRKSNIPASQVVKFLQTMPAENVDNVELNYYTGAGYEASSGPVINIVTVRRKDDGWEVSTSSYGMLYRDATATGNVDATITAHKCKTFIYGTIDYLNDYRAYTRRDSTLYDGTDYLLEHINDKPRANTVSAMADVVWEVRKNHTLDFNAYVYFDMNHPKYGYSAFDSHDMTNSISDETGRENESVVSGTVDYIAKLADDLNLKASYGYVYAKEEADTDYLLDDGFSSAEQPLDYLSNSIGMLHIIYADLDKQFGRTKLGVGFKMNLGHLNSKSGYSGSIPSWLSSKTKFTGHENIYAIYASVTHRFSEKFSFNAGLRGELTDYKVRNTTDELQTRKTYFNLFPTFSLTHQARNVRQTLYLRTSISRPDYMDYIPGKQYVSEHSYTEGNPDLKPMTSLTVRYVGTYWDYAQLTLGYQRSWNMSTSVVSMQDDNVTEYKQMNHLDADVLYAKMVIPFTAFGNKLYGSIEPDIDYWKSYNLRNGFEPYRNYQLYSNIEVDIYYDPTDRLSFELWTYFYLPAKRWQYDNKFRWGMSFGASYYLRKQKNLLLSLVLNNLANTGDLDRIYHYSGSVRCSHIKYVNQFAKLSLTWNFSGGKKVNFGANISNDLSRFTK